MPANNAKKYPYFLWSESEFVGDPMISRMAPQHRLHLRSIIMASLVGEEPYVPADDRRLYRLADARDAHAWDEVKECVMEDFVKHPDDAGLIGHPIAIAIHEDRLVKISRNRKAAQARWGTEEPAPTETPASLEPDAVSEIAIELAARLVQVKFHQEPDGLKKCSHLLEPLVKRFSHKAVWQTVEWVVGSPDAKWFQTHQFATCRDATTLVNSFVHHFQKLRERSKERSKFGWRAPSFEDFEAQETEDSAYEDDGISVG